MQAKVALHSLRVLLVCAPGLFAEGFARSLAALAEQVDVLNCRADMIPETFERVGLVLVDLDCMSGNCVELVGPLRLRLAAPLVIIGSAPDDRLSSLVIETGAVAYLPKTCSEAQALTALRRILMDAGAHDQAAGNPGASPATGGVARRRGNRGRPFGVTPTELRVLSLLCEGLTNLAIGNRLGIRESTAKLHLVRIYQKLGVENRIQAIRVGQRLDVIREMQLQTVVQQGCLVEWLLSQVSCEQRRKGELLFKRGDPATVVYYIQKGSVALGDIGAEVRDGELFGEVGVFSPQQVRTSSARCTADTRLFRLSLEQVRRLYFENPQFAFYLTRLIAERLASARLSCQEQTH